MILPSRFSHKRAFTLIELLVVLSIIAMLGVIAAPEFSRTIERARSTACLGNLRSLGVAVNSFVSDNDGRFPYINNPPPYEVYEEDDDLPDDVEPVTMMEAFGQYGISDKSFRCPSDVKMKNFFSSVGTSYEWVPRIDDEPRVAPKVLSRRRGLVERPLGRITIIRDWEGVHFGRSNRLYGDGRVVMVTHPR